MDIGARPHVCGVFNVSNVCLNYRRLFVLYLLYISYIVFINHRHKRLDVGRIHLEVCPIERGA
jgi:hypothetical protein